MKIETQPTEDHQVKMTIEIEPASFEDAKRRAARKVAQNTKIPGFRPGKAPYQVIVRQVGESQIIEEALDILVKDIYPKALDETGIKPYGPGSLENVTQMDPPILEFKVPLEPEVTLSDYHSIRMPYEPPQVNDQQVDDMVKNLRNNQAVVEPVDRPVQEGDIVYLHLSARRIGPAEDNAPEMLIEERSLPLLVKMDENKSEWPFPGFSRQLIGLKTGDEQTFTHTFGSDSEFETLKDVEAEFNLKVDEIKSRKLPVLDDEFAKSVGAYENVDELISAARASLERQTQKEYDDDYGDKLLDELVSLSEIKYPPQMLEDEIDRVIHNLEHRLEDQGMEMALYLKSRQLDMPGLREEAQPAAEKRLKHTLILAKLAELEKVEVTTEELQQETMRTYSSLYQTLPEKEARRLNDERVFQNVMNSVYNDLLVAKSLDRMRKIASGIAEAEAEAQAQADALEGTESETAEENEPENVAETQAEASSQATPEDEPPTIDQVNNDVLPPPAAEEQPDQEAETTMTDASQTE